jgi:hypothetical protein
MFQSSTPVAENIRGAGRDPELDSFDSLPIGTSFESVLEKGRVGKFRREQ